MVNEFIFSTFELERKAKRNEAPLPDGTIIGPATKTTNVPRSKNKYIHNETKRQKPPR